jgi:hypothetical protein
MEIQMMVEKEKISGFYKYYSKPFKLIPTRIHPKILRIDAIQHFCSYGIYILIFMNFYQTFLVLAFFLKPYFTDTRPHWNLKHHD